MKKGRKDANYEHQLCDNYFENPEKQSLCQSLDQKPEMNLWKRMNGNTMEALWRQNQPNLQKLLRVQMFLQTRCVEK